MKCINKFSGKILSFTGAAILACSLLTGCGAGDISNLADTYDIYQTTASYGLNTDPVSSENTGFFAEDLCTGGTTNTKTDAFSYENTAAACGVFNLAERKITYAKNIYQRVYPASTTKILTAYIALKYGNLNDTITVSSTAAAVPSESSVAGLKTGDRLTLEQVLYGLLLMSGNDCANVIAEYISGSTSEFAALMNEEAQKLGAVHSHFVNPHGYPQDDHYTTLYDMYLIFQSAIKIPEFEKIIGTVSKKETYQNASGQQVTANWENSNWYLAGLAKKPTGFTVIGGKTGSSDSSGYCLVLYSTNDNNEPIVSIVMKDNTKEQLYALMSQLLLKFGD